MWVHSLYGRFFLHFSYTCCRFALEGLKLLIFDLGTVFYVDAKQQSILMLTLSSFRSQGSGSPSKNSRLEVITPHNARSCFCQQPAGQSTLIFWVSVIAGLRLNMRAFYAVACACILSSTAEGARITQSSATVSWLGEHKASSLATVLNIRGGAGRFHPHQYRYAAYT